MSIDKVINRSFEHTQLKDRVYEHLRAGIIDGEFETGAALRELEISKRLGVSKTPVREAFVRLRADGFVELIPYRGAVVTGYSKRRIREMYEVRELVEGRCAARAAENSSDSVRRALERNLVDSREAIESGNTESVIELFEEFDRLIYAESDNEWIRGIIHDLEGHQRRIGRVTVAFPGRVERSIREHEEIFRAITKGDPAAAEKAMYAHVNSVMVDQLANVIGDGQA